MADIAILVAEEYERRVKNSRKFGDHANREMADMSCVSDLAQRIKNKIGQGHMELVKWALEPKTQIGLAASYGFFSA